MGLLLSFIMACGALVQPENNPDPYAGRTQMNGYSLNDFKGFPDKWNFVTVRYRRDSSEMRFTYANELAFRALAKGLTDFPDGAMFGKIGRKTEDDPAFPSSAVPSGVKRFQFMVRDRIRFKASDGWGYALFDENGKTFPGEPHAAAQACVACHQLAAARGFVFSELADFGLPAMAGRESVVRKKANGGPAFKFSAVKAADLPQQMRHWLADGEKEILSLDGELRHKNFAGTLDEIIPVLSANLAATGRPSMLLASDKKRFSLVTWDRLSTKCGPQQKAAVSVQSAPEIGVKPVIKTFCQ